MSNPNLQKAPVENVVPTAGTVPAGLSPQMTTTMGKPEPPPQVIQGSGSIGNPVNLNPYGLVPQMNQGAICFDLKAVAYEQFIAAQKEIIVTSGMSENSIFAQIPLDPTGEYVNDFIKSWTLSHNRWSGPLLFEITNTGNPLFTGMLGVGWYPTKYPGKLAKLSEVQKYSYQIFSVTLNSTQTFVLNDATDRQFYRWTDDSRNAEPVDRRPHLVFWIMTTIVNPMEPVAQIRIRISSKLPNMLDAKRFGCAPFLVADPQANQIVPGPTPSRLEGLTFGQVFPYALVKQHYMFTDGIQTLPARVLPTSPSLTTEFEWSTGTPFIGGAVYPDNVNKRPVVSSFTTGVFQDSIRYVIVLGDLDAREMSQVAQSPNFVNIANDPDKWLTLSENAIFISEVTPIYVKRNLTVDLLVYEKDSYKMVLKQQTSMLTQAGAVFVLCYEYNIPSNSLTYAQYSGVPNTSPPNLPKIPHSDVTGPITYSTGLTVLPSSWIRLAITRAEVTGVSSPNDIAPTTLDSTDILMYFDQLVQEHSVPESVLQFSLVDPESKGVVCVVRYLPTRRAFVLSSNSINYYAVNLTDISQLLFSGVGFVDSSSALPQSDLSTWSSRRSGNFKEMMRSVRYSAESRAALAAEGMEALESGEMAAAEDIPSYEECMANEKVDYNFRNQIDNMHPEDYKETMPEPDTWTYDPPQYTKPTYKNVANSPTSAPETHIPKEDNVLRDALIYGTINYAFAQARGNVANGIHNAWEDWETKGGSTMQKNSFEHEDTMQQGQFQHDKEMQQGQFQHETDMQNAGFQNSRDILHNQQQYDWKHTLLEGAESVVNTATGGLFGLAGSAVTSYGNYKTTQAHDAAAQAMESQQLQSNQQIAAAHDASDRSIAQGHDATNIAIAAGQNATQAKIAQGHDETNMSIAAGQDATNRSIAEGHDKSSIAVGAGHDAAQLGASKISALGNVASAATGGAFGLVTNALNDATKIYTQKQDFENRSKLMTQGANQEIYAAGQSSPALSMASG